MIPYTPMHRATATIRWDRITRIRWLRQYSYPFVYSVKGNRMILWNFDEEPRKRSGISPISRTGACDR